MFVPSSSDGVWLLQADGLFLPSAFGFFPRFFFVFLSNQEISRSSNLDEQSLIRGAMPMRKSLSNCDLRSDRRPPAMVDNLSAACRWFVDPC